MEASPVRFEFGDGVTVEKFYHHWFTSDRIPEWLAPLCGQRVYECVWEPLVRAKFGKYADEISAVWMWKKLVHRGSTRGKGGGEQLAYFKGGFGRLAAAVGGCIETTAASTAGAARLRRDQSTTRTGTTGKLKR